MEGRKYRYLIGDHRVLVSEDIDIELELNLRAAVITYLLGQKSIDWILRNTEKPGGRSWRRPGAYPQQTEGVISPGIPEVFQAERRSRLEKNADVYDANQETAASIVLSEISRSLLRIESMLRKGKPFLLTEDAVKAFRTHIKATHRCPENYGYLIRVFETSFRGRNVTELASAEIEAFLSTVWGSSKASTLAKRTDQLSAFFSFCDRLLKRNGSSGFTNPCSLIERVRVVTEARRGFIGPEKMQGLLGTCTDHRHWLIFAILITAVLRVSELLKLRPMDVDGRVLTLIYPKSGREREYGLVPKSVADKLREHVSCPERYLRLQSIFRLRHF